MNEIRTIIQQGDETIKILKGSIDGASKTIESVRESNNKLTESNNKLTESNNKLKGSNNTLRTSVEQMGEALVKIQTQANSFKSKYDELGKNINDIETIASSTLEKYELNNEQQLIGNEGHKPEEGGNIVQLQPKLEIESDPNEVSATTGRKLENESGRPEKIREESVKETKLTFKEKFENSINFSSAFTTIIFSIFQSAGNINNFIAKMGIGIFSKPFDMQKKEGLCSCFDKCLDQSKITLN